MRSGILRVERRIGGRDHPLARPPQARVLPDEALAHATRTFGVGGLFGWWGEFRNAELGPFTLYATRTRGFVLVRTPRGPVVFTPSSPEEAVRALNAPPS